MAMCWGCGGYGDVVGDDNYLFCASAEPMFPLNGAGQPCPCCGGSGEVEGWFENNGGW